MLGWLQPNRCIYNPLTLEKERNRFSLCCNEQEINFAWITHCLFVPVPFGIKTTVKKKKEEKNGIKKAPKTKHLEDFPLFEISLIGQLSKAGMWASPSRYRNTHNEEIVAFLILYGTAVIPAGVKLGFHTESLWWKRKSLSPSPQMALVKRIRWLSQTQI